MILVKASPESEAGVMPEQEMLEEMAAYHEELARAGVLLDASGLHPSSKGWRIRFSDGERRVVDGYTLIEVRQLFDLDDFEQGPGVFDALSADEKEALVERCAPHDEELRATGRLRAVASLEGRTAKVLRPEDGETAVTDGPFAETRELIGSFFIVEADDLEEAVEIASLHPAARFGDEVGFAVEVRPIDRMAEDGA